MDVPDYKTCAAFLAMLDVYPDRNAGEFDRLQRELTGWWQAGGSCREFVEHHQKGETRMTWQDAMAELRARYVPPG